jgi:uroporphyrinogen III methyltransferase / synthase
VTVYLVGAGPGDPGLLTRRGAEVLGRADVVVHDRLVPRALLSLAPAGALVVDVGKHPDRPRRQDEIDDLLIEHGRAGRTVVRLKGGDPFVFGRGGEEALSLRRAGVPYEVVPGVTAAFAAPAYAGVPVTHRGLATSVTVVTGRVGDRSTGGVDWEALARAGGTLVVLMGMQNRGEIARRLIEGGQAPDTPVLVVEQGSTSAQRSARSVLGRLGEVDLGAPATIVIGAVAGLELDWFGTGPLAGTTVVVTRPADRAGPLAELFGAAGAAVLALPVVRTDDPEDGGAALRAALARVGEFAWVVFSSATAVERTLACLSDVRALGGVRLGTVGPATARALSAWHLSADAVGHPSTAEGLVAAMPEAPTAAGASSTARWVLYPRAAEGRDVLAKGLTGKGWDVEEVVAYRTTPATGSLTADALDAASAADVVTFTSPSTVRAYVAATGERPVPPVVACIGPITAEAARQAGLTVTVEADEHDVEGLVKDVVAASAERSTQRRHRTPGPDGQ